MRPLFSLAMFVIIGVLSILFLTVGGAVLFGLVTAGVLVSQVLGWASRSKTASSPNLTPTEPVQETGHESGTILQMDRSQYREIHSETDDPSA